MNYRIIIFFNVFLSITQLICPMGKGFVCFSDIATSPPNVAPQTTRQHVDRVRQYSHREMVTFELPKFRSCLREIQLRGSKELIQLKEELKKNITPANKKCRKKRIAIIEKMLKSRKMERIDAYLNIMENGLAGNLEKAYADYEAYENKYGKNTHLERHLHQFEMNRIYSFQHPRNFVDKAQTTQPAAESDSVKLEQSQKSEEMTSSLETS